MSSGAEPSGASPAYRVLRALGQRAQRACAAMRDGRELVVVQRFTKATRPPAAKDADADAEGVAYVAADAMAILLRDARCLAKNWHPNVVRVRHVDLLGSELVIATELVDGVTLQDLVALARATRRGDADPVLPLPVLARIVVDVLGGLHGLHGLRDGMNAPLGVFHGELCPANVVIGKDGVARVAHAFRPRPVKIGPRSEGIGHASPEALAGEAAQDARADLYSVGAILWEGLTGKRLFEDADPARVAQRQREEDLPRPALPAGSPFARLADVAMRALAFDPALRYRTASEMATDIRRVAGTRLAPGSAVAQTVGELAGDRIRARRAELDPSSSGARRPQGKGKAKVEVDTVPKAPPKIALEEASGSERMTLPPETARAPASEPKPVPAAKPSPPKPSPRAVAIARPAPARPPPAPTPEPSLDDLPGPRASSPSLPELEPPPEPSGDALALAAALEVKVDARSLAPPDDPPPASARMDLDSIDVIAVEPLPPPPPPVPDRPSPVEPVPPARESGTGTPVAVLSLGPEADAPPPRRRRLVPLVLAITGIALVIALAAGIASMGGSSDTRAAAAESHAPSAAITEAPPPSPPEPAAEPAPPPAATETASSDAPEPVAEPADEPAAQPPPQRAAGRAAPPSPPAKKPKKSSYEPLGI